MENWIIGLILVAIVVAVVAYLVRAKKKGQTCVGCPYCKQCGGHCDSTK